ncbi:MAG: TonB-dependent siderophore receptor [Sphingomicrobium sp.]
MPSRTHFHPVPVTALLLLASAAAIESPAFAQRTDENALRSAEDAFGSSIGNESIGLYHSGDVRGFSPFTAGNIRLEGLYYDAVRGFVSRLVRGSTIQVGISAQGYPFPAPTGIADYRLRLPGDEPSLSTVAIANTLGFLRWEADAELPLIVDKLSLGGGVNISRDPALWAEPSTHLMAAAMLRWRPTETLEVIPFWSGVIHRGDRPQPRYVVGGDYLPVKVERGKNVSQPWMHYVAEDANYGTIARYSQGSLAISAGLFRSLYQSDQSFSDQYLNVSPDGVASSHRVVRAPDQKFASTSGELRGSRTFDEGSRRHILHLAVRGREHTRRYGGSSSVDLGPDSISDPDRVPEPDFTEGPQSRDRIRQLSFGAGYEGRWAGVGEITLGLQKTSYRKNTHDPFLGETERKASPWLYNASAAAHVSKSLAVYAGFTKGLEESGAAPDIATNRDEAPPAILTKQYDAGVRWTIAPGTRLIAGLFNVEKPYFSLDPSRLYRRLGEVSHRGAEISFTSDVTPNLSLLAGAVLLDARVSGEAAESGLIGKHPVGSTARTLLASAEYRPPQIEGLAFDVTVNSYGKRVANTANTLEVPPAEIVDLGVRYRWNLGGTPTSLRLLMGNVFDAYVWEVQASNAFFYNAPRHVSLRLTADL